MPRGEEEHDCQLRIPLHHPAERFEIGPGKSEGEQGEGDRGGRQAESREQPTEQQANPNVRDPQQEDHAEVTAPGQADRAEPEQLEQWEQALAGKWFGEPTAQSETGRTIEHFPIVVKEEEPDKLRPAGKERKQRNDRTGDNCSPGESGQGHLHAKNIVTNQDVSTACGASPTPWALT